MLNNEPFSEEFKSSVKKLASGQVEFGLVENFDFPDHINITVSMDCAWT